MSSQWLIELSTISHGYTVRRLNSTKSAYYLSSLLLSNTFQLREDIAEMLYQLYTIVEGFVAVAVEDVIRRVRTTQAGWLGLYIGQ